MQPEGVGWVTQVGLTDREVMCALNTGCCDDREPTAQPHRRGSRRRKETALPRYCRDQQCTGGSLVTQRKRHSVVCDGKNISTFRPSNSIYYISVLGDSQNKQPKIKAQTYSLQ